MALQFVYLVTLFLLFQQRTSEGSLKPRTLSSTRLKRAAESTDYDEFAGLLDPILRSRIPGTKGHHFVKEYIITFFQNLGWSVSTDQFDQDTVIGPKRFTNIIATSNPGAEKFLLLTAHYDSKMITQNGIQQDFVAATDSAVPCAMMMSVAKNLDLNELKKNKYGLEMVFFDGEEAFKEWSKNDSLYGSQHLAKIWSNPNASGKTHVSSIEAFILLDLIGAKNPKFYSSYATTHWMFERLQRIETRLRSVGLIKGSPFYFNGNGPVELGIEDDHIPFAERGVPILHLISVPFPTCWHQLCDNRQNIDQDTVHDLLKIFQIFFREMMRV